MSSTPTPAANGEREKLRAERKLHLISEKEQGDSLDNVSGGVYGFTSSPGTEGSPLFDRQIFQSFEIHKTSDGNVHFVGYMTAEEARQLESSADMLELKLYPEPHENASRFVSVPGARVLKAKPVVREHGNYLPILLAPR
ncbi:MAG: hypothetical protein IANPNBLG_03647 [Bryobacteraceae bacterium]|nr:hypothetical protein [Bryobacteraceae bacterium]